VNTKFGNVRIKLSRVNGNIRHVAPEYEDCRKLAAEKNVPLHQVMDEAVRAFESSSQGSTAGKNASGFHLSS
jgi:uncharacterized protein (DUF111 family)